MIDLHSPRYELRGQCNRCGQCCCGEDCEYLEFEEYGIATCKLYNSPDRPSKCGNFPAGPPLLIVSCGYRFFDLWEARLLGIKEV
jgi:hypothetical protein